MLRQIIFDWSGVLADDIGPAFRATNETLRQFGAETEDFETFRREFQLPVDRFYAPRLPRTPIADIDRFFFTRYAALLEDVRLYPDIPFLCQFARMSGLRLFILSTAEKAAIETALARESVRDFFESVCGGAFDKVVALPDMLERLDLAPDETLFIGDMPHDLAAAHAAGAIPGASLYGYSVRATLEAEGAEEYFESPRAIFDWLFERLAVERLRRPIATVGGLVFNDEGEVLLVRTRKWGGLFGTPGGKVAYGETPADAFAREVREETGLEIKDVAFVSLDGDVENEEFERPAHFLYLNFRGRALGRAVTLNHEAFDWRWAAPRDALPLPLNRPTRALLEREIEGCKAQ